MGLDKAVEDFGKGLDKAIEDPAKRVTVALVAGGAMLLLFFNSSTSSLHEWAMRKQLMVPPEQADVAFGPVGLDWTRVVLLVATIAFLVLMGMMGFAMNRHMREK